VGDAEIDEPAGELGREMHEGYLLALDVRWSAATINHVTRHRQQGEETGERNKDSRLTLAEPSRFNTFIQGTALLPVTGASANIRKS